MRKARVITLSEDEKKTLQRYANSRRASFPFVERSKITLLAAEGLQNTEIAREIGIEVHRVGKWRKRFAEKRIPGIQKDAPRSGRKVEYTDDVRQEVVNKTLHEKPKSATHWSRSLMAKETGLSDSTIGRIWKEHGLKPHLLKTFKLSNDKNFVEKLEDIVGLYMSPPENAIVLSCDEKS